MYVLYFGYLLNTAYDLLCLSLALPLRSEKSSNQCWLARELQATVATVEFELCLLLWRDDTVESKSLQNTTNYWSTRVQVVMIAYVAVIGRRQDDELSCARSNYYKLASRRDYFK